MSLKHRKVITVADDPAAAGKLRPSDWGSTSTNYDTAPTHVFSGGAIGALAMRDTDAVDGFSWLPSAAGVLVSDGDDEIPVFRPLLAADIPALPYAPIDLTGFVEDTDIVSLAWGKLTGVPAFGGAALLNVGAVAGTVAGGDHLHAGVYEPAFGTLGVAKGGTGLAAFTAGDLPYASGLTTLSPLAAVAVGSVLISGGVGAAPAWSTTPTLTGTLVLAKTNGATQVLASQHDPTITGTVGTAVGNVGGVKFGLLYQPARFTNGPGGEVTYIDDTWHIGMNLGALTGGIGRTDTLKPNLALSFESKFYSGTFGQEFHLQGVTSDGVTTFRPMSFFLAHDASDIGAQVTVDRFIVSSKAGVAMAQITSSQASLDLGTPAAPIKIRFSKNNVSAIQQLNSTASAYVDLLYLDGSNIANIAAPLNVSSARAGTTFATFQPTSANSNDIGIVIAPPAFTGNYTAVYATGSVTGLLQTSVENNASAANAHARQVFQVAGASGGDPYIYMTVPGVTNWSFGIDNSDSDNFVWSAASSLGASNAMKLTTAGVLNVTSTVATAAGVAWNFGALTTGSSGQVVDATKFVTVTVAGVSVKLAVLT